MSSPNSKSPSPVFVLKSVRPPLDEYQEHLRDIWANRQFTNSGPKHNQLQAELCAYLGVDDCALVGNGTFALMAALSAFGFEGGEVITTPFTFVATAHCLKPLGLTPKFVDIEPQSLTIDPAKIEAAITPETRAILGVHVYGNPCQVEALQSIADKHNLKLIYDAAHAFGVEYHGKSLLNYGDASCLSFHATKAFHTFEGGAVISSDPAIGDFVRRYQNFGITPEDGSIHQHGLNTKMSELHAAAGLVNLPHYETHVAQRKRIYERYQKELSDLAGLSFVSYARQEKANYNYCPVLFENARDEIFNKLAANGIFTRKYFYPLLTDMPAFAAYQEYFPVASRVAEQVLALPIYHDLGEDEQNKLIGIIREFLS